jgi:hypothetical protein
MTEDSLGIGKLNRAKTAANGNSPLKYQWRVWQNRDAFRLRAGHPLGERLSEHVHAGGQRVLHGSDFMVKTRVEK